MTGRWEGNGPYCISRKVDQGHSAGDGSCRSYGGTKVKGLSAGDWPYRGSEVVKVMRVCFRCMTKNDLSGMVRAQIACDREVQVY